MKGQGIRCLSNLRQMSFAWGLYADDHEEAIPPNRIDGYDAENWVQGWLNYAQSVPDNTNTLFLKQSLLWPYLGALDVWKCPADTSTSFHGGQWIPRVRSISMNCFLNGPEAFRGRSEYKVIHKRTELTDPSPVNTFVMIDQREDRINNGFFAVDMAGYSPRSTASLTWVDYPASYHNGAGGITFADGHAEIKKWLDPRTGPKIIKGQNIPFFVASPHNKDVLWLQERTAGLIGR